MQAIVYHQYGPPQVLELREIDKPVPAADQVLIRVRNASLNPYDWHFLRGTPSLIRIFSGLLHPKFPRLGADVSGEVESVGSQVTGFKPGDQVFGTCQGAFAQFACASEKTLAIRPEGLTLEQAASLPIAGITALQAVRDKARLQSGQSILINGAAGGVGSFAVQIAKHLGATVTGVCSARNADLVRSIGADSVIDYTREDFTRTGQRYDVIFDLIGNHSLVQIRRALHPQGTFVPCGGGDPGLSSARMLACMLGHTVAALFISQRVTGILAKVNTDDLEDLAALVEADFLMPVFDRTFPLAETGAALSYIEQGHARGKVILAVA
jgi:NADPH:quinone reductase-like Zn-dependent oxidoreductase